MDENTKVLFRLENRTTNEVWAEETRTLREWTGLTDEAMAGWTVTMLDAVLDRIYSDWMKSKVVVYWKVAPDEEM